MGQLQSTGGESDLTSKGASHSTLAVAQDPPASADDVESYTIGDLLGEGGFCVVHDCTAESTGERLAVKFVKNPEDMQENIILSEYALLRELDHENIMKFVEVLVEASPGHVCAIMPKYEGQDLMRGVQRLEQTNGQMNVRSIRHIFFQAASSIDYLHERNIAHLDVKGENFVLSELHMASHTCRAVLSDFTTAMRTVEGERLTHLVGTFAFHSPERLAGSYTQKADVWSLGVVFVILAGGTEAQTKILRQYEVGQSLDPCAFAALPLPPDFRDLTRAMLRLDEDERLGASEVVAHPWVNSCLARRRGGLAEKKEAVAKDFVAVKHNAHRSCCDVSPVFGRLHAQWRSWTCLRGEQADSDNAIAELRGPPSFYLSSKHSDESVGAASTPSADACLSSKFSQESVGVASTHDAEIQLISKLSLESVDAPSTRSPDTTGVGNSDGVELWAEL